MKHHVLIAIPTMGNIRTELAMRLEQYRMTPWVRVLFTSNIQDVAAARNTIALYQFSPISYTHLVMVDADTVPPPEFIERMLAADRPIVSAVTHIFRPTKINVGPAVVWPNVWIPKLQKDGTRTYFPMRLEALPKEGLLEEPGLVAGCSCMMIRSEVIEKLLWQGPPLFKTKYLEETQEKVLSEDLYFCERAEQAGFPVSVLCDLVCDHFKTVSVKEIQRYEERMAECQMMLEGQG